MTDLLAVCSLAAIPIAIGFVRDLLAIVRAASLAANARGAFDEADPDDLLPPPLEPITWPCPERVRTPARRSA